MKMILGLILSCLIAPSVRAGAFGGDSGPVSAAQVLAAINNRPISPSTVTAALFVGDGSGLTGISGGSGISASILTAKGSLISAIAPSTTAELLLPAPTVATPPIEINGSVSFLDALGSLGFVLTGSPTASITDGSVSLTYLNISPFASGSASLELGGTLAPNTDGSSAFIRTRARSDAGTGVNTFDFQDDFAACQLTLDSAGNRSFSNYTDPPIVLSVDTAIHSYELRLLAGGAGVELLEDGVSAGTLASGTLQPGGPLMRFTFAGTGGTGIHLERFAYSPPPGAGRVLQSYALAATGLRYDYTQPDPNKINNTVLTDRGSLITRNSVNNVPRRILPGTDGYVLSANSVASDDLGLEWVPRESNTFASSKTFNSDVQVDATLYTSSVLALPGDGTSITIQSSDGSVIGGSVTVRAKDGADGNGPGGDVVLVAGNVTSQSNKGSSITVQGAPDGDPGPGEAPGGGVFINGGSGTGSSQGGPVYIVAGPGGSLGGGTTTVRGGPPNGNAMLVGGGDPADSTPAGNAIVVGGQSLIGGGDAILKGGQGAATGSGGKARINGGHGDSGFSGGDVLIEGGTAVDVGSEGEIVIKTADLERVRVTDAGLFGIGTDAPAAKLDVEGDAQFGAAGTKSTFTTLGALNLATDAALNLSGPTGDIVTQSSVTANSFFGGGEGLTNISSVAANSITGDHTNFSVIIATEPSAGAGAVTTAICPESRYAYSGGCECTGAITPTGFVNQAFPTPAPGTAQATGWSCQMPGATGADCIASVSCWLGVK